MVLEDFAREEEAEPVAVFLERGKGRGEAGEGPGRDALARVAHGDPVPGRGILGRNGDDAAGLHGVAGVGEEVEEHAAKLALIDLDRPDSLIPVTGCQFQNPAWLPNGRVVFIDRAENLVTYDPDSGTVTLLVPQVEFFSVSASGKLCATDPYGRLSFYSSDGQLQGEGHDSVSMPMLSPDGRYLAFRRNDHDLWIRDLDSGSETEVGLGDPRNWSADSRLLLFQGRRSEEGRVLTVFRVADALTGVSIEVPQSGFMVDAVLFP